MTPTVGALVGLGLGVGLVLLAASIPAWRRPTLLARVAAQVSARPGVPTKSTTPILGTLGHLLEPTVQRAISALDERLGNRQALVAKLERAGSALSVERYRLDQLVWAAVGLAAGLLAALSVLRRGGSPSYGALLALCATGTVAGFLLRDWALSRSVARRTRRIAEQFPVVAELFAFAVIAGEAPSVALARVAAAVGGEFGAELDRCVAQLRTGTPFVDAVHQLARRLDIPAVDRFVDGLTVAIERGSPLADVMRAQAADARSAAHQELIETAGRRDVVMLVPVVFLILPTVVVIALFPGIHGLDLIVP